MKHEFKVNDVLAEIGNSRILHVISAVGDDGYIVNYYFDNKYHYCSGWISFKTADKLFVKVDEWNNGKMKGIEE